MEMAWDLFHRVSDVDFLVRTGGLLVLILIVLVEFGLLAGFFLPVRSCGRITGGTIRENAWIR
jgi:hypothetical protein